MEKIGSTNNDLNTEVPITYSSIENLVIGDGMHMDNAQDGGNDTYYTHVHAAYTMDKLMMINCWNNIPISEHDQWHLYKYKDHYK